MSTFTNSSLSSILESIADELDISPSKYNEAVDHYTAVGEWLERDGSALSVYAPEIYPQGSFRLGTVVRPVKGGHEADYDIDLVCQLGITKETVSPKQLKQMIGDRLKEHEKYSNMLDEEGSRCWTLEYAEKDGIGFHLDALPAIPEDNARKYQLDVAGVPQQYAAHAIAITERLGDNNYGWAEGGSNPRGYGQWFDEVNAAVHNRIAIAQKRALFESHKQLYASIDDVPDALVRTPLQRAIQILKRHRDVRFSGHEWEDEKPISIIITTLAALAYEGENDIASALAAILAKIEDFQSSGLIRKENGKWNIPNPVNPGENLANRWNEQDSHRAQAFFEWVGWARQDIAIASEKAFADDSRAALATALGVAGDTAPKNLASGSSIAPTVEDVPTFADSSHCQPPPWPEDLRYQVSVSGHVRRGIDSLKNLWKLSGSPVPKHFGIRFRAVTNVPTPFEVKWQIINTGSEAAAAGRAQLRGGFDAGVGANGTIRYEGTAYRGTHSIEAFVIKDGVCVARSRKNYVRIR